MHIIESEEIMTEQEEFESNETQGGGVTFGRICGALFQWKRLLILVGVTLVAAVIAFVAIHFTNANKTKYEVQFNYSVNRVASSDLYGNGQFFADETTLTAVKNSDERFQGVDVQELLYNGKYPILVTLEQERSETNADLVLRSYNLLTVPTAAFSNDELAEDFLNALIGYAKEEAIANAQALSVTDASGFNGYQARLKNYNTVQTYEEKLAILVNQRDYLLELYDRWIDSYGGLYYVQCKGLPLQDLRTALQVAFSDTMYSDLADELNVSAYLPTVSNDYDNTISTRLNTYREQRDLNEKRINDLWETLERLIEAYGIKDNTTGFVTLPEFSEYHNRIAALQEENILLTKKIETIENAQSDPSKQEAYLQRSKDYGKKLDAIYNVLKTESEKFAPVMVEIVTRESYVTVENMEVTGGSSTLMITAVVAIIALLVTAVVICAVVFSKEKTAAGKSAPAPADNADRPQE